jgi:hypothetical protein
MKITTIMAALFLGIAATVTAQDMNKEQPKYVEIFSTGYDGSQMAYHIRPEGRYVEMKGSPYLYEAWSDGRIMLKDDTVGAEFSMRYNVYGNEMQFINGADTFAIANPLKLNAVWLEGHRFEYLPFTLNKNANMAYFEVLNPGKVRLLVRHSSRIETGMEPVTPYHCQNSSDRFVTGKVYYYQTIEMDMPSELPSGKRDFLSIRAFNRPELKEFMHSQKIRMRNEQDLGVLFTWINQLP